MDTSIPLTSPPDTQDPVSTGRVRRVRSSPWAGLGSLITGGLFNRAMGSVRLLVFAPLLGTAGFGALRLATTASAILSALAGLGLATSYLRYLPETSSRGESAAFLRRTLSCSVAMASLVALALLIAPRHVSSLLFSDPTYSLLAILVAVSLPLTALYKSALGATGGLGKFHHMAIGESLQNLLYLVMGVAGLVLMARSSEVAFGAFLIGMVAGAAWMLPRIPLGFGAERVTPEARAKVSPLIHRAFAYSFWYAVIPLFQYLFDFIDRWVLAHFRDLETAGAYSLIPILTGGMFLIGGAFGPIVARKGAQLRARSLKGSSERLVWGTLAIAALASLLYSVGLRAIEPLIWRVAGPRWEAAAPVLPVFLAYYTFFNLYYLIGTFALFTEKTWVQLLALGVGAALNTGLNLALVPRHGIAGAALATLLGLVAALAVQIAFVHSQRIRMSGRAWVALALGSAPLLPLPALALVTLVACLLAWRTNLILSDSDRRMATAWMARAFRGVRRGAP